MAQEVAKIGNWDWNIIANILTWSDETYHHFGLKPKEIIPTFNTFEKFVHPDDRLRLKKAVELTI